MAQAERLAPFECFNAATKRIFSATKRDLEKAELRRKKEKNPERPTCDLRE